VKEKALILYELKKGCQEMREQQFESQIATCTFDRRDIALQWTNARIKEIETKIQCVNDTIDILKQSDPMFGGSFQLQMNSLYRALENFERLLGITCTGKEEWSRFLKK